LDILHQFIDLSDIILPIWEGSVQAQEGTLALRLAVMGKDKKHAVD
jgi:hypothetical protein